MEVKGENAPMDYNGGQGYLQIKSIFSIKTKQDLQEVYTPNVAKLCKTIAKDINNASSYTWTKKIIAVITDGTSVLGLGNIGPLAGYPIIEAKSLIYNEFANIQAIPICMDVTNNDEFISTVRNIALNFSAIHLEDIKAPDCFYIEKELQKNLSIPIYHDDQHGTAIAVLAGLYNCSKLLNRSLQSFKIVINGAGASGIAVAKLLLRAGVSNIICCDKNGILNNDDVQLNFEQKELAVLTNSHLITGGLNEAIQEADVFIGLSIGNVLTGEMIETMGAQPIIFALANPIPEISYEEAIQTKAKIIATGSSEFPNQINNLLIFPGLMKAILDNNIRIISDSLKIAIAKEIADSIINPNEKLIIPNIFTPGLLDIINRAVKNYSNNH